MYENRFLMELKTYFSLLEPFGVVVSVPDFTAKALGSNSTSKQVSIISIRHERHPRYKVLVPNRYADQKLERSAVATP